MTHLDTELQLLKKTLEEMGNLVLDQLTKTQEIVENPDLDLINSITANEKLVDAFELKINMDCENILALFSPVANDLRLVLAVLKINYNLERIGDYANSIAKIISTNEVPFDKEDLNESQIIIMFELSREMLVSALESFDNENVAPARNLFKKDTKLNEVNRNANTIISELIAKKPSDTKSFLSMLSIIRKLERVGDQTKNIAEEIIFYLEAQVIRHKKKIQKSKEE